MGMSSLHSADPRQAPGIPRPNLEAVTVAGVSGAIPAAETKVEPFGPDNCIDPYHTIFMVVKLSVNPLNYESLKSYESHE